MKQLLTPMLALILAAPLLGADVLTISSPADWQVVQRQSREKGRVHVAGSLVSKKETITSVEARLSGRGLGGEWQKILFTDKAENFRGVLDVPAGGWYKLEVRATANGGTVASAVVEHVGIGEVFVVAGQSNSANSGEQKLTPKSGLVSSFDGKVWRPANDPQPGAGGSGGTFIPPLGDTLTKTFNVPVGFVPCGVGATSVREWLRAKTTFPNPPTLLGNVNKLDSGEWEAKGDIFQRLISRLQTFGERGFRAVLWHQGESDANQQDSTRTLKGELYQKYLEMLIRDTRSEIGWEAPWFVAQASYHNPADTGSSDIRSAQKRVADSGMARLGPDTDALGGDHRDQGGKGVHFSGKGQLKHAELWALKISPWLENQLGCAIPPSNRVGPPKGTLVIVGGGGKGREILEKFVALAGGNKAVIAVIPTANEGDAFADNSKPVPALKSMGAAKVFVLHTRDRKVADSEEFAAQLKDVTGIWFGGGRQWRLVDSYLGTKSQKAFFDVLDRGGVIGGSSAGASIQSSYMVRGAREGNMLMMAPGYETGLGFLENCAIDQHVAQRKRQDDLVPVVTKHPHLLGIGLDEDTAVIVQGDRMEVMGAGRVGIYDPKRDIPANGKMYYFLNPGDKFDLKTRRKLP